MKYALLMYSDPERTKAMTASELDTVLGKHEELRSELTDSRELLGGAGLDYPESTKTLRLDGDAAVVADGPLAESGPHMTAYYVVECASLERAQDIARRTLDFHVTAVEVRGIHDSA